MGVKRAEGVDHRLVEIWDTILTALDSGSAASCVVSLDFEKVFKRLSHNVCLSALEHHGPSLLTVDIMHSFLQHRTAS